MGTARANQLRKGSGADAAAEEGIGPWKLGMLSAVLYLWDIMWWAKAPDFKDGWEIQVSVCCAVCSMHRYVVSCPLVA